jgi:hypothetical protein
MAGTACILSLMRAPQNVKKRNNHQLRVAQVESLGTLCERFYTDPDRLVGLALQTSEALHALDKR